MAKRLSNNSPISDILKEIIITNKLTAGINEVDVKDAWKNLMGNGVNSYTKNIILKNSTLYVELTSSVLREELSYGKDKIIKLINDELRKDVVKDVILR
jgi:glycine cleavage system protein P-like pyridoxal-binding family